MKIKRVTAVAFLEALGFAKASEWEDQKMSDRLSQVPSKVERDTVPEDQLDIYDALENAAKENTTITVLNPEAKPAADKLSDPPDEGGEPMPKKKVRPVSKKLPAKEEVKKEKSKKPERKPKTKPAKEKDSLKRDQYGSAEGTVRYAVHAQFSNEWKTDVEMAKGAGVSLQQARLRIRQVQKEGGLEKQNRGVEYRLPAKKVKK